MHRLPRRHFGERAQPARFAASCSVSHKSGDLDRRGPVPPIAIACCMHTHESEIRFELLRVLFRRRAQRNATTGFPRQNRPRALYAERASEALVAHHPKASRHLPHARAAHARLLRNSPCGCGVDAFGVTGRRVRGMLTCAVRTVTSEIAQRQESRSLPRSQARPGRANGRCPVGVADQTRDRLRKHWAESSDSLHACHWNSVSTTALTSEQKSAWRPCGRHAEHSKAGAQKPK